MLLPNFILSCNSYQIFFRFYTHDQALEAIYQAQKMVLGDNLLKVSTGSGSLSIRPSYGARGEEILDGGGGGREKGVANC